MASDWSESMASKPSSSMRSTMSLGPTMARSNSTLHVSVERDTRTDVIPGRAESSRSTVEVQDEHVMP